MDEPQKEPALPEEEIPVEERAEELKLSALATAGYLGHNGEILDGKIEDKLFDRVVKAEVLKTSERKTTAVTRTALTKVVVPLMPGPGDYEETDDPEAAQMAWNSVNSLVWRMLDPNKGGRIQERLNGEHALLLCRTAATAEKGVQGVYVTRDWACIKADFVAPDQNKVERAIRQQAANAEMGSERLPEHGKRFRRELNVATKAALTSGISRIDRQIEAANSSDDDGDGE